METNQLCLNCLLWPFLFCHRLFRRKRQYNASFPRAVSNVFLRCPHHNRQAVVFGAHPGKPCGCGSFGTVTVIAIAVTNALLP